MPLSRASCKTLCPCPFCHTLLSLDTPLLDCAVFFSVFLFLSFKRSCHWVFGPSVGGLGFLDSQFSLQKPEQEEWSGPSRSGDSDDIEQSQARRAFHQGPSVCIRCPPMVSPILAATPPPPPRALHGCVAMEAVSFGKCSRGTESPGPQLVSSMTCSQREASPILPSSGQPPSHTTCFLWSYPSSSCSLDPDSKLLVFKVGGESVVSEG